MKKKDRKKKIVAKLKKKHAKKAVSKKPILLSQLIYEGIPLDGPQIQGDVLAVLTSWDDPSLPEGHVKLVGACTLGKAMLAKAVRTLKITPESLKKPIPVALYKKLEDINLDPNGREKLITLSRADYKKVFAEDMPNAEDRGVEVGELVVKLNDDDKWKSRRIADLLARNGA